MFSKVLENLPIFIRECAKLETSLKISCRALKELKKHDEDYSNSIIIAGCVGCIISAVLDPTDNDNREELDNLVDPENLVGLLKDKTNMKESFKTLDEGYNKKHQKIFDLVSKLNDNVTINDEDYNDCITTKNSIVNKFINEFIKALTPLFDKNDEGPLNSSIGLIIFSITAIRKSIYSFGVESNPQLKELTEIFELTR